MKNINSFALELVTLVRCLALPHIKQQVLGDSALFSQTDPSTFHSQSTVYCQLNEDNEVETPIKFGKITGHEKEKSCESNEIFWKFKKEQVAPLSKHFDGFAYLNEFAKDW